MPLLLHPFALVAHRFPLGPSPLRFLSSGEQLNFLMDTVASGHTFMDTEQTYHATRLAIESLALEVR